VERMIVSAASRVHIHGTRDNKNPHVIVSLLGPW
jgi:hypothetical protein